MNPGLGSIQGILLFLIFFNVVPLSVSADVADCNVVITGEANAVSFTTISQEGQDVPKEYFDISWIWGMYHC